MIVDSTILTDLYWPVREDLDRVEGVFDAEIFNGHPFVNQLCDLVRNYRGKMLRPALVLLFGQAGGGIRDAHHTLAAVVEMVHLATLVHDDVLDDADVRRQRPTINALEGNKTAVLLGDYLISHAYHLCSSLDDQWAARTIGATTNTVCAGELMQISHRHDPGLTEAAYLQIIGSKTASLTGTCCGLGARYAGVNDQIVRASQEFGVAVGMAFQIVDDLLDLTGEQEDTGKSMGRDLAFGNATLPIIHCLSAAPLEDQRQLRAVMTGDCMPPIEQVRAWLQQAGSIEYAYNCAREYVQTALDKLGLFPSSPARDSLSAMAEFILRRRF